MKVLVSPTSLEEARKVAQGGVDIIDIKNTNEGSLGANFPWVIQEIVSRLSHYEVLFSATIGDLPYKPGTAALAALGATSVGARYVKAGLHTVETVDQAVDIMQAVKRACGMVSSSTIVVASGYADYRRFNGIDPESIVMAASRSGSDVVMLDTAIKDGRSLFDNMGFDEIKSFVDLGHRHELTVALAGSVGVKHLKDLHLCGVDIIGVRGAVCDKSDRTQGIDVDKVREFMRTVREITE